jgi:hypothetical protein
MTLRTLKWGMVGALVLSAPFGCSDDHINTASGGGGTGANTSVGGSGSSVGGNGTGGSGSSVGGNGTGGGVTPPTSIAECQGHIYACGDLLDNDGDGLVDTQDPDCLGPCDNTEDSLFGGIPGQPGPACAVDCYFDQDSGSGNDDCYWDHQCDPHEVDPNYYPEPANGTMCEYDGSNPVIPPTGKTCDELDATQSQACFDYCGPLTPNGCDCFGCCELPAGSGSFIWLGSEGTTGTVCTLDKVTDPTVCHPCKPVAACLNDCDPCELCIGKPEPGPDCNPGSTSSTGAGGGGGGTQCPAGVQECGLPGQPACPAGFFCNTGCCYQVPQ